MNGGSVLEYTLAFTSASLDKYCSKWSAPPKTGFIDITTSKDFYRIYGGLQIVKQTITERNLSKTCFLNAATFISSTTHILILQ